MPGVSVDVLCSIIAFRSDLPEDRPPREWSDGSGAIGVKPTFEAILQLFHRKVYNLAYRLLGDSDEAADLTQETFVKAYRAYGGFEGTAQSAHAWLCRLAANGCKKSLREIGRRDRYEARSVDDPVGEDSAISGIEVSDGSANPASVFERRDLEAKIQNAILSLPPEFRIVVVLRDMQELSYREIAEATGATLEVVKVRLFRGRAMLRRRLAPYIQP